jgi:hypothetical protein
VDVREECRLKISNSVADLEKLGDRRDTGLGKILYNMKIPAEGTARHFA